MLVVTATVVDQLFIDGKNGKKSAYSNNMLLSTCQRLSLYTNVPQLLSTATRPSKIDLKHLDGMRVLLVCAVVLAHTYYFPSLIYFQQMRRALQFNDMDDDIWTMPIFSGIPYTMEAFFVIR